MGFVPDAVGTPSAVGKFVPDAPAKPAANLPELPFVDRTILASLEKPEEKHAYLEKKFGAGSVSKDAKGMVVKVKGKPTRVSEGFWATLASDAPETALGIAGAAEGGAAGTAVGGPVGGVVGAVVGGAAGAVAGRNAKEIAKSVTGLQRETPGEFARGMGGAALGGAASEVGGQVIGGAIGKLTRGPMPAFLTGATKEIKETTDKLLKGGARPPAQSTMPDARKLQRVAILADKLAGPSKAINEANTGYLYRQADDLLNKAGIPKLGKDDAMSRLERSTSALSSQETGQLVQSTAKLLTTKEALTTVERSGKRVITKPAKGSTVHEYETDLNDKGTEAYRGVAGRRIINKTKTRTVDKYDEIVTKRAPTPKTNEEVYLHKLAAGTPEEAYTSLVHGGSTDVLEKFAAKAGADSPVMVAVQQQALKQLLAGSMMRSAEGKASDALLQGMSQFTEKQQKLLFPNGLHKDILALGKEIQFLFPGVKDPAMAGLTAGAIMQRVWYNRFYAQGTYALLRSVLQKPSVIRRLAIGFRGDSSQREAARAALRGMLYSGGIEASKPSFSEPEHEQSLNQQADEATAYAHGGAQ